MSIKLIQDTIDTEDMRNLISWLQTNPRLTKNELTIEFEKRWSEWLGCKYSVYVNSGSSANLAAIYGSILYRNQKHIIIAPALSWSTTVSPALQLGIDTFLCDCDKDNLGLNIEHLKKLVHEHNPTMIILVHVLGIPNNMQEIINICQNNNILLIEDCCEAVGSAIDSIKVGNFGDISTFSFYYGHHMSTIEGGMVCTNNEEIYHILLSIRSHGWDRDLPLEKQKELRKKYKVDNFRALYTFYYPGFNLRSTDLQAFIGLEQLKKLDSMVDNRNKNYIRYHEGIKNIFWEIDPPKNSYISNFAYPIITKNINKLIKALDENDIECRPLICGSINEHPFWYERYGKQKLPNAKKVHQYGIYVPNNHQMTDIEIDKVIEVVNWCI